MFQAHYIRYTGHRNIAEMLLSPWKWLEIEKTKTALEEVAVAEVYYSNTNGGRR